MNKDALLSHVGKTVRVDRGGPESRVGKVLAVESDYFALYTKDDGVVYYKSQHIKSITVDSKATLNQESTEEEDNVTYYQGEDFQSVISNFKHSWVKVNRGGPESLEGVLYDIEDEYVIIISEQELIQLSMFHIRNISFGPKSEEKDDSNSKNNNSKNNNSKNSRSSRK